MATTTTTPSRAADVAAQPGGQGQADQCRPGGCLDRDDHPHSDHPVPVLLDAAHRVLHLEVAVLRPGLAAAGRLHLGRVQAGARASRHQQEAQAEGGSGAAVNFWLYLRNSIIFATLSPPPVRCSSAPWRRTRSPGCAGPAGTRCSSLFLAALMVPPIFTTLPNFILIKNLGLLNTFPGLILPYFFMTPFAIFFLRQFFLGINREIEEAAKLDGAGHWRIFFRIILPMSSAPIATLAILTFINQWNEYFWPLLVGTNEKVRVLTVALGVFRSQTPQGGPDWAGLMAAVLVAALPILILFFAFAKKIVNSIGFSGMK